MGNRIHTELNIEELERRAAPVVLSGANPDVTFTDGSGDTIQLQYRGPGTAHVRWMLGGENPLDGDAIGSINFAETTERSSLTLRDLDPDLGGNTFTGGMIRTMILGDSFGSIRFFARGGTIEDTTIRISNNLRELQIQGNADDVDLNIGGDLGRETVSGRMFASDTGVEGSIGQFRTDGEMRLCEVAVGEDLGQLRVGGETADCTIEVERAASQIRFGGDCTRVRIDTGSLSQFMVAGDTRALDLWVEGNGRNARIRGDVTDSEIAYNQLGSFSVRSLTSSTVGALGGLGTFQCTGDVINSSMLVRGNLRTCRIGGQLRSDVPGETGLLVTGNATQISVGGLVTGPLCIVGGDLGNVRFAQPVTNMAFTVGGNLGNARFGGTVLLGTFFVAGNTRSVVAQSNAAQWTVGLTRDVGTFNVRGALGRSGVVIRGDAGSLQFGEMVTDTVIEVDGAVNRVSLAGGMTGGSALGIDGPTSRVQVRDGLTDSALAFNGGATNVQIFGAVTDTDIEARGHMTSFQVRGDVLEDSTVLIFGDVRDINIMGSLNTGARVQILGQTGNCRIAEGVHVFASLSLDGVVGTATIGAPVGGAGVGWGSVRMGVLQRSLRIDGGIAPMGLVDIAGSAAGARIDVRGDMDGQLLAGVFGDVTISGTFRGTIGDADTAAGTGNTLRTGTTAPGSVISRANAFEFYA